MLLKQGKPRIEISIPRNNIQNYNNRKHILNLSFFWVLLNWNSIGSNCSIESNASQQSRESARIDVYMPMNLLTCPLKYVSNGNARSK